MPPFSGSATSSSPSLKLTSEKSQPTPAQATTMSELLNSIFLKSNAMAFGSSHATGNFPSPHMGSSSSFQMKLQEEETTAAGTSYHLFMDSLNEKLQRPTNLPLNDPTPPQNNLFHAHVEPKTFQRPNALPNVASFTAFPTPLSTTSSNCGGQDGGSVNKYVEMLFKNIPESLYALTPGLMSTPKATEDSNASKASSFYSPSSQLSSASSTGTKDLASLFAYMVNNLYHNLATPSSIPSSTPGNPSSFSSERMLPSYYHASSAMSSISARDTLYTPSPSRFPSPASMPPSLSSSPSTFQPSAQAKGRQLETPGSGSSRRWPSTFKHDKLSQSASYPFTFSSVSSGRKHEPVKAEAGINSATCPGHHGADSSSNAAVSNDQNGSQKSSKSKSFSVESLLGVM